MEAALWAWILPIAAIVVALVIRSDNQKLKQQVQTLQAHLRGAHRGLAALRARVDTLEAEPTTEAGAPPEVLEMPPVTAAPAHSMPPAPTLETPQDPVSQDTAPPLPIQDTPRPETQTPIDRSAASSGAGLERQIGTRLTVWLGAAALALAGAFLVKYSVERGLIGPTTRVVLGLLFGAAMLAASEWLLTRAAGVARGLAAAGVATLFAVLLAGVRLYGLIPPVAGFIGFLIITAAAVLSSLRHGQIVAVLGLLGAFVTPSLIGSGEPHPVLLFGYLVAVQAGLLVISRKQQWWPLAGLTLLGSLAWALLWLADLDRMGGGTASVGGLILVSLAGAGFTAVRSMPHASGKERALLNVVVWGGALIAAPILGATVAIGDFGLLEWSFLAIVGAGCIVLGRVEPDFDSLPWITLAAGAGMLFFWKLEDSSVADLMVWSISCGLGMLYLAGGYLGMWGSERPWRWAALSGAAGIVHLLVPYLALEPTEFVVSWGIQSLVLAAIYLALLLLTARREQLRQRTAALAALAVAVTTLVSLAAALDLERAWITVAWALEVAALAWLAGRFRMPILEKAAGVLAVLVAVRLLLNPFIIEYPIGTGLIWNWLLYGYGIPIAAFLAAAWLFRRGNRYTMANALEAGAITFGAVLLGLEVRQGFHPGEPFGLRFLLLEWGALCVGWLLYGLALLRLERWTQRSLYTVAGGISCTLGVVVGLGITGFIENPLFEAHAVGAQPILNSLLFLYALPGVLCVLAAGWLVRREQQAPARLMGAAALVFGFLTVTLEVRQWFHGTILKGGETSNAESYTYSLAWVLLATGLLIAGIVRRGAVLRYGSAVVMLLAVGKVFLFDTAHLKDLYRVGSFLGLGISLMLLAFLYQKFVFSDREP